VVPCPPPRRRSFAWLLPAVLAVAAVAGAQPPGGGPSGALRGEVRSPEGEPVAGARVKLEPFAADGGHVVEVATDAMGRWRRDGLAVGQWSISVAAEGCRTTKGQVSVASGANPPLDVILEVDSGAAVRSWLEQGNRLLESGRPAAAQAFYEQALTVVQGAPAAEIHVALARAQYLRDDADAAASSLELALLADPSAEDARRLLAAVLAGAGREGEAAEWLAVLDGEGPAAAGRLAFGSEVPERPLAERPTGRFRATIDAPSAYSGLELLLDRHGPARELGIDPDAAWDPAGETFEVYVPPPAAGAGAAEAPYGVFVWVSPTANGGLTDREMIPVLDATRTIWIGANRSGNPRPRGDRIRLALDAAAAAIRTYPVDPDRVYVGGYSGGGRMASSLALLYPEVFRGGVYFMGADLYRSIPVPHRPGAMWAAWRKEPSPALMERVRERSRFVFVTGTHDFNRAEMLAYRREYLRDGLDRVTLIEIPDVGHYYGFRARELREALAALDAAAPVSAEP